MLSYTKSKRVVLFKLIITLSMIIHIRSFTLLS